MLVALFMVTSIALRPIVDCRLSNSRLLQLAKLLRNCLPQRRKLAQAAQAAGKTASQIYKAKPQAAAFKQLFHQASSREDMDRAKAEAKKAKKAKKQRHKAKKQ